MFGVKSPVTAPPKFVFVVVKLPTPRPPNACTAACGSWAEAGDVTQRAAASTATNGRVRMVDNLTDAGTLTLGKRCTRSEAANSFDKWAAGAHAGRTVTGRRQSRLLDRSTISRRLSAGDA